MKIGRILLILCIIILGIIIYLNKFRGDHTEASPQNKSSQPMMVSGIIVTTQDIEDKIFASGTLLAREEVEIRNEVAGRITSILFKEGTKIKKGELLLTLYDDDLIAQQKKLQLQKDVFQKTEERQKDLLSVNGISQQEYELSQNQLMTMNADLELVNSEISKTRIRAPFNGVIGLKTVSPGAYVAPNTRIATIQSVDSVKLEFTVPERYRSLINDGTEISFTTESSEGVFTGKIYAFEPKIDLQTRSVVVRAICSNKDLKLFPGSFANIEIPLKKISKAILVPTHALIPELKSQKLFISKNGKAEKVSVDTGVRNDSAIQITSGIQEGDTVLITGLMQMKPGIPVKVNIK